MRILLVSTGYPPEGLWGTETYTREIARGLVRRGHEVVVLHPVRDAVRAGESDASHSEDGVRVVRVERASGGRKRLRDSYEAPEVERAFSRLLDEFAPDLVHCLHLLWSLSVRLPELARAAGVPSLLTLTDLGLLCHRGQMHDWRLAACTESDRTPAGCARCIREPAPFDSSAAGLLVKRLAVRSLSALGGLGRVATAADVTRRAAAIRRGLSAVTRCIAPTRAMGAAFEAAGFPAAERLVYALDDRPLRPARARPAGAAVRLRFFGQLAPHKGPATLVRAAALLAERAGLLDWSLHLHGAGGPELGARHVRHVRHARHARYGAEVRSLMQAARRRGARVALEQPFLPEQLPSILAQTECLVIPSEWMENAPLSALQARAAAVPIVASDVPGLREVVEPDRHGWLFAPGDVEGLARRLEWLVRSGPRRLPQSSLPLSLDEHLERLEALYEGVRVAPRAARVKTLSRAMGVV